MTPDRIVVEWPPVVLNAQSPPEWHFVHLQTSVSQHGAEALHVRQMGQTLWIDPHDGETAGMAWDWVELQKGVVAMANPLGVMTNLKLVGPEGKNLSYTEVALYLNELVRSLPWQQEVSRALEH